MVDLLHVEIKMQMVEVEEMKSPALARISSEFKKWSCAVELSLQFTSTFTPKPSPQKFEKPDLSTTTVVLLWASFNWFLGDWKGVDIHVIVCNRSPLATKHPSRRFCTTRSGSPEFAITRHRVSILGNIHWYLETLYIHVHVLWLTNKHKTQLRLTLQKDDDPP